MRKTMKKFLFVLAVGIMLMSVSLSVSAASVQNGNLAGKAVRGNVTISANNATASTLIDIAPGGGSSVSVNLTYSYIDTTTNTVSTVNAIDYKDNYVLVSRSKPSSAIYRSWRATGDHTVRYSGQTWTANTNVYY